MIYHGQAFPEHDLLLLLYFSFLFFSFFGVVVDFGWLRRDLFGI